MTPEQRRLIVAERFHHRFAKAVVTDDAPAPVVERPNIPDRDLPAWPPIERRRTHPERHELRRVRVRDRHDIGPSLEDVTMQEGLTRVAPPRLDGQAVEAVLAHVTDARAARGDKARHVPAVRIRQAARTDMRLNVEDAFLAR